MNFSIEFNEIVERRRSVRIFDTDAFFDKNVVLRSLGRATLAPNSSNLQLWAFYRVKTPTIKAELSIACMGQSAAKTAQELVVFVTKPNNWKANTAWNAENMKAHFKGEENGSKSKRALEYYQKLIPFFYRNDIFGLFTLLRKIIIGFNGLKRPIMWLTSRTDQRIIFHKSVALAAQTFMLSMTAEGYDTCPMEGFDKYLVKKILNLEATDEITMIVACGKGKPEGIYYERARLPIDSVVFTV
jgi:nitroreductase